jgi:hypothetical protein
MNSVLVGALAGIAGTVAMTAAMRAMHRRLAAEETIAPRKAAIPLS